MVGHALRMEYRMDGKDLVAAANARVFENCIAR
jgi:hypothetical protein